MAGLDDGLTVSGNSLLVRRVDDPADELATYRQWQQQGAVDAVVLKDVMSKDPRPQLLRDLRIPAVMLVDVSQVDGHPSVHTDNAQTMRDALAHLVGQGHRHIARVTGPAELAHTQIRTETFLAETIAAQVATVVVVGDYSEDSGRRRTQELLTSAHPPTAVIFDNDLMAVGGLAIAHELGIAVPERLSLLAWDDSILCQLTNPPLSALSHDVHEIGVQLSRVVHQLVRSGTSTNEFATQPLLVQRGTSGTPTATTARPDVSEQPDRAGS